VGKKTKNGTVVKAFDPVARLKRTIRGHFTKLGFTKGRDGTLVLPGSDKEMVRRLHQGQRIERLFSGAASTSVALRRVLHCFANGAEIDPHKISLRLARVSSHTVEADIFRIAALTWSVPVSAGFGRRLRYLVWDDYHDRVAGIIALGDPVFNLSVRDELIGWKAKDRAKRLVNLLDAYVLGAVPPYNMLLGGKAVACLVRSREIFNDFKETYRNAVGIISGKAKRAKLLAVTTTSSLGRSSVYNRLRLGETAYFTPIGFTEGWGHFHITDKIFDEMREYLRIIQHPYVDGHEFGEGPNWRFRTIRVALGELGIRESVLRHGIKREVFVCPFGKNALEILRNGRGRLDLSDVLSVAEISDLARERWMIPRSVRRSEYREWRRDEIPNLVYGLGPESSVLKEKSG
jgi:hypothetical protein